MSRAALAPVLLVLACSGTTGPSSTSSPRATVEPASGNSTSVSLQARAPAQRPGEMTAVSCPAMPFQQRAGAPTKLAFCENLSWRVSRCERQGWDNMTAEETCRLVAEQDRRRAALQEKCMARSVAPDLLSLHYDRLQSCSYPPNGDGTYRVPFCSEALECYQRAGFEW